MLPIIFSKYCMFRGPSVAHYDCMARPALLDQRSSA